MPLRESTIEDAALSWFEELGYTIANGPTLAPGELAAERDSFGDVAMVARLRHAICQLNPAIPEDAREEALRKVLRVGTPSLTQTNRAFHAMLRDGVPVEYRRKDGSIAGDHVQLVDFDDVGANDWSRTVQKAATGSGEVSEHKQLQLKFWTEFRQYMESKSSFVRCQKPLPQHWMNHAIGRNGAHLASIVSSGNFEAEMRVPEIRVELTLDGQNAKQEFAALEKQKAAIENAIGSPLIWHNPENKNGCKRRQ